MTIALLCGALLMALAAGTAFLWAARSGEFDDIEEAKYVMLRSPEEENVRQDIEA